MKLNDYQNGAIRTAIYPGRLAYPALGLCGEIGELTRACDKGFKKEVPKEIGDVLWYAANVASDMGLAFSVVCKRKTFQKHKDDVVYLYACEACIDLATNAGVVAENVKKTIRDNDGTLQAKRRDNICKALKQIMLTLAEIAHLYDTTLEECAKGNLAKLKSRQERGKLKGSGDNR